MSVEICRTLCNKFSQHQHGHIIIRAPILYAIHMRFILRAKMSRHLTVDQLEEVVADKVLLRGGVKGKLESLGIVHGALLLIDL